MFVVVWHLLVHAPTLNQQSLHTHVGVQLEYTHMLPYAGTVQSCSDDISPGAAGQNKQNLQTPQPSRQRVGT
jgi:hypothetical protein